MIHTIGDLVQNIGVLLAAFMIWWQPFDLGLVYTLDHPEGLSKWVYADPICTFLFTVLVIFTTLGTLRSIVKSVLLSVPDGVDANMLLHSLEATEGVRKVYDLHCFKVGQGKFLTAHCTIDGNAMEILARLQKKVQKDFGFSHSTFQLETEDYNRVVNKLSLGNQLACNLWSEDHLA